MKMSLFKYMLVVFVGLVMTSCLDDDPPTCEEVLWFADQDGDTLGDVNNTLYACVQPEGYVANSDDLNDSDPLNLLPLESGTVSNLHAPTDGFVNGTFAGEFTKFDFETGEITTSDTEWDIAFRATTILVNGGEETGGNDEPLRTGNGGAYIIDSALSAYAQVDDVLFVQDSSTYGLAIPTGSGNGWYTYDFTMHLINPIIGKIIVIKTRDGRYAKIEIRSYYKDLDQSDHDNGRYYTFDYVYQPNAGITTF